jgi:hypothetical protein
MTTIKEKILFMQDFIHAKIWKDLSIAQKGYGWLIIVVEFHRRLKSNA